MNTETMLMHTNTGSVDTAENWADEGWTTETTSDLVPVVWDEETNYWMEA